MYPILYANLTLNTTWFQQLLTRRIVPVDIISLSSLRRRVMLARTYQNKLALTFAVAYVVVVILVLSSRQHLLSELVVSRTFFSNVTCNHVCYGTPATGNRLGNYMFFYAVVHYVAWLTGRAPCVRNASTTTPLDRVFDLDIARVGCPDRCPVNTFSDRLVYAYDPRVTALVNVPSNQTILLVGYFSSWKYADPVASRLRRSLKFRRKLVQFADNFLSVNVPPGWSTLSFVRVGVHVRRGDFLSRWAINKGFTVATPLYLQRALGYFVERFERIQFIVASNDIPWCRKHIISSTWDRNRVNITFSENHSAGQDLALLASCSHIVITSGTYGWWAAWLANGITVYYADFPRQGSSLGNRSRAEEYYPPNWIGING